jgi:hypothetical protein
VIQALRPDWPYGLSAILNEQIAGLAHRAIGAASGGLLLAGTAAAAAATAALWAIRARRPRAEGVLLALLLAVPAADVFRWKLQLLTEATVSLDDAQAAMQRLEPLPYSPRRSADYANERCRALEAALPTLVSGNELAYDVTDAFLHVDPPRSRYWITQWQTPFDDLHRVRAGQPLGGKYETAPLELQWRAEAPRRAADDPFRKLMGETADKLRVFSRAHVARSDQDLADFLNRPDYRGDTLLLSPRPGLAGDALEPALAAANEELPARVDVRHFDGNRLRVELRLPPGRDRGWLSYADVWHPEWIAEIDGTPVPVERASLAYKAVELRSNVSVVEFRFHSPGRVWSYRLLCFNSLLWIAAVLFALGAELRS